MTETNSGKQQDSVEFFHSLFEQMRHGFALHEILCDSQGNPVDYRFLYVNPAFESITGLHSADLQNRTVREIMPEVENHWIERYGQVALSGVSQRFEEFSSALGQYFSVYAFSPARGQFAIVIDNTSTARPEEIGPVKDDSLHRSLFENHPTAIMVIDPTSGRIVDANLAACQFYGWKRSEFRERFLSEINTLTPEEIGLEMQQAQTRAQSHFYFRHRLASGEIRDVEVYAGPIPWEGRSLLCSTVHDITEQKRMEEDLRKSREQFELAVKGSQNGIWDWDLRDNRLYLSPRWKAILGHRDDEISNRWESFETRLHPDDRERVLEEARRYLAGEIPAYRIEFRLLHKDGTYRWIKARGEAVRDENGVPYRMAGSHDDITDRKQLEETLAESEAKYRAIVDQASDCVLIVDPETGLILEGNARFTETMGYRLPEDWPLYVTDIVADDPAHVDKLLKQVVQDGILGVQRRVARHRNGTLIPIVRSVVMVHYGDKCFCNATFRDISMEMRREQEVLRDAAAAQRIQEALLTPPVSNQHVTIEAMSRAHLYVGGDLYFLDWRHEGRLLRGFLVDTMGHGLGTALHAAAFHVMLREVNETDLPLDEQVKELNRRAARHFDDETFAAAIAFEVDLDRRELSWVAAGIPEFYISTVSTEGKILAPGIYLGINNEETYELKSIPLTAGNCIYFCTDGLTERMNSQERLPLGDWAEMQKMLRRMIHVWDSRDDATTVCLKIESFPTSACDEKSWPKVIRLDGYGDYRRRKKDIAKTIAEVTGQLHSRQEVAVNEAIANALECRDGIARHHQARITFRLLGNRFIVRVKTSRIGFAGNAMLERLRAEPELIFAFGGEAMMGRGIPMMFSLADCMVYNEDGNEVLLAWKMGRKAAPNEGID